MGYVKTHATRWSAEDAVAFVLERAQNRSTAWERLCLGLCANAYGFAASGTVDMDHDGFSEACEYWAGSKHQHRGDRRPPVGALACWTAPGRAGHISVVVHSQGRDVQIASNGINDRVDVVPLSYIEKRWNQKYEGWLEPDFPRGIGSNPFPQPKAGPRVNVWWRRLAFGVEDSDSVRLLQRRLNQVVNARLKITGEYDDRTRAAVQKFQQSQGWRGGNADGLIYDPRSRSGGKATTELLFPMAKYNVRWTAVPKPAPKPAPKPPPVPGPPVPGPVVPGPKFSNVDLANLRPGVRDSDSVRALQERLNTVVNAKLPLTGNYLDQTTKAVQRWQRRIGDGADADGLLGPRQFVRLFPGRVYKRRNSGGGGDGQSKSLSARGAKFIGRFEGFRGELYNDPAGHATIGYGHLVHRGNINGSEPAEFRRGITERRALELLRSDAAEASEAVNRLAKVSLNQHQFDALVSFTFNLGSGNLSRSTLLKRLNTGDYDCVPDELGKWVKAGGRQLKGLVTRRTAEGVLFTAGRYAS